MNTKQNNTLKNSFFPDKNELRTMIEIIEYAYDKLPKNTMEVQGVIKPFLEKIHPPESDFWKNPLVENLKKETYTDFLAFEDKLTELVKLDFDVSRGDAQGIVEAYEDEVAAAFRKCLTLGDVLELLKCK